MSALLVRGTMLLGQISCADALWCRGCILLVRDNVISVQVSLSLPLSMCCENRCSENFLWLTGVTHNFSGEVGGVPFGFIDLLRLLM
jgi:hypothetical protein